jgi:hypothetical protein
MQSANKFQDSVFSNENFPKLSKTNASNRPTKSIGNSFFKEQGNEFKKEMKRSELITEEPLKYVAG